MPPIAFERFLAPAHQPRPPPSQIAHDPPQPPTGGNGGRNAEMHREQLVCRHPLLSAHQPPANAGQSLVPVGQVTGHGSGLYRCGPHANHTIWSTNSALAREMKPTCRNFYPRPLRPGFFLSCEKAKARQSVDGKQLAAVLRIKALWRLHCCALPVLCWGGAGAPESEISTPVPSGPG